MSADPSGSNPRSRPEPDEAELSAFGDGAILDEEFFLDGDRRGPGEGGPPQALEAAFSGGGARRPIDEVAGGNSS